MDRIEFVVADQSLPFRAAPDSGGRSADSVEAVINGESLVEMMERVLGREPKKFDPDDAGRGEEYSGMSPDAFFEDHRGEEPWVVRKVLACGCGDEGCAWVAVEIRIGATEVVWDHFQSSGDTDLTRVGPFRFDRAAYMQALSHPTHADIHERLRSPPGDTTE